MNGWFGVVAPAGTPPDTIARLNRAIGDYLQGPEIQQRLIGLGLATEGAGTPESTARFLVGERERWRAVAKSSRSNHNEITFVGAGLKPAPTTTSTKALAEAIAVSRNQRAST